MVPTVVVALAAVRPPNELMVYAETLLEPLLATNRALIDGVMAMAEGAATGSDAVPVRSQLAVSEIHHEARNSCVGLRSHEEIGLRRCSRRNYFRVQAIIPDERNRAVAHAARNETSSPFFLPVWIQDLTDPGRKLSGIRLRDQGLPSFVYQDYKGSANFVP